MATYTSCGARLRVLDSHYVCVQDRRHSGPHSAAWQGASEPHGARFTVVWDSLEYEVLDFRPLEVAAQMTPEQEQTLKDEWQAAITPRADIAVLAGL